MSIEVLQVIKALFILILSFLFFSIFKVLLVPIPILIIKIIIGSLSLSVVRSSPLGTSGQLVFRKVVHFLHGQVLLGE